MSALEAAPVEAPAMESAPSDNGGFVESLDSFFDSLDNPQVESQAPAAQAEAEAPSETPRSNDLLSDLDFEDNAKDWTPQAARRFKELKAELKTYKTRADELEQDTAHKASRLQELEAVANNPEYANLQDRVAQYEQQMVISNLEQSQAYKNLVEQPLMTLVSEADAIAEKYSIDPNQLIEVLANSDEAAQEEQLSELLINASDRDKFRVYKIIEEVTPILQQRQVLQEHAAEALREAEHLQSQHEQQELINRTQQRQEAANAVADKLRSKVAFLSGVDGVDLNQLAKEAAQIDPATLDHVNSTYQAMAAKLLPKMVGQYMSLQKEIDSLTERLADYDRSTPKAGGGSLNTGSAPTALDGKSFVDAVAAAFG